MKNQNFLSGITRNIFLLGLVSLLTDLSSQMIFPLIPLYLTTILRSGASIVGIIEGAAEATASTIKVVSGYFSDKIKKRKKFIFYGYSLSTITKPLFALATSWPIVLIVRITERIGKGLRNAPRDALIAESTPQTKRGKAYGFQRAMDATGSLMGALLAFFLLPTLGFKKIFLFAFIPGILASATILFIKERKSQKTPKRKKLKVSFKILPKKLKLFIFASTIFALAQFGYAFMILKAKNAGFSNQTTILLYSLFYLFYIISSTPIGILSDKRGRKPVLIFGYLTFTLLSIALIFTNSLTLITILFAVYGIFYATIDTTQRAFVVDLSPKNLKATALGAYHTSIGLIALPAGFLAGFLWDNLSPSATFLFSALLSSIAFIVLTTTIKDKSSTKLK